jgi:hypothetical protein
MLNPRAEEDLLRQYAKEIGNNMTRREIDDDGKMRLSSLAIFGMQDR